MVRVGSRGSLRLTASASPGGGSLFARSRHAPPGRKEQGLNEEQLRAKLQLLDSTLQAEDLKQDAERRRGAADVSNLRGEGREAGPCQWPMPHP